MVHGVHAHAVKNDQDKRFHLFYCIAGTDIVSFCVQLDGVCLSENKRITYLLTCLLTY